MIRSKNIGPKKFFDLIKKYHSPQKAFAEIDSKDRFPTHEAKYELDSLANFKASYITFKDRLYPELLRNIYDPPPFLSLKGNKNLLSKNICSIVGARNASLHGMEFAKKIAYELSNAGIIVASGLAIGIDKAAHEANTQNTIAIIAGGIDNIYPKSNEYLYHSIAENGLILAESPIRSAPTANCFPKRNRIIAGISKATIVVEAANKSGSLITAKYALEYGRDVGAVPGFPLDMRSKGGNKLIKEGASLIETIDDILEFYDINSQIKEEQIKYAKQSPKGDKDEILRLLSNSPICLDTICNYTKFSPTFVQMVLIEEELAGNIVRYPGNKFALQY